MKKKDVKAFLKSISKHSAERRLFEMLEKIGETLDGDVHIIQTVKDDVRCNDGDETYRVYLKTGYCFDAMKVPEYDEDDNAIYDFQYYAEWEGFDGLRVKDACIIIENFMLIL